MSKPKKEPSTDATSSSSLRRTILNAPSSSRRSDDYDGYNRNSRSKSSDSSPERKKTKFAKPIARGSESGIIFDKGELKKISITIPNKSAKPPLVHITNPETITPVRRPELTDYGEIKKYESLRRHRSPSETRRYEGKRPIFSKTSKENSDSPEDRNSSSLDYPIEGSRRKGESRKRHESPEYRSRKSKRDTLGSRKLRRNHSTPSRHSCSSDSSSSSDERKRKKHYYRMRSEREREERRRREYERELILRDIERRSQRPLSPPPSAHSNGGKPSSYSRERTRRPKEEDEDEEEAAEEESSAADDQPFIHPPVVQNTDVRMIYPARLYRPPYMMRVPVRAFAPPFPPGYPHPPRPPGFYPMPPPPPVAFRPLRRPMRPPRGFFRPSK